MHALPSFRPPASRSLHRAVLLGSAVLGALAAASASGCSHDWDAFDPRLGGAGGAGAGGETTGTGASTSASGGTGGTTSTGGAGGTTTAGGTGGATSTGGTGGTTTTGGTGGTTSTGGTGGTTTTTTTTTTTGTGGEGGGGPLRCGGTSVLADDFDMGDPGEVWDTDIWGGADVAQAGGELVVTLPSGNPSSSGAFLFTQRLYNLREDAVSVEVTSAGNTATTAVADFVLAIDYDNYLEIYQRAGTLYFSVEVDGLYTELASVVYSSVTHHFWRFRDDGTNMNWETSADGVAWTTRAQVPTIFLFPLEYLGVNLGGLTDGGEVSPGEVHYDRLNGGGAPAEKWCPLATLTDDFEDGEEGRQWARSWSNDPALLNETGGELVLALLPNDTAYAVRGSSAAFDLTESEILFEVPVAPGSTSHSEGGVLLSGPGANEIAFIEDQGKLYFSFDVAGVTTEVGSLPYSPVQHRWWRIRESASTLYWETSPDGKAWTVKAQHSPVPFAIDALDVEIGGGTYDSQPSPGAFHFDNLGLPPP